MRTNTERARRAVAESRDSVPAARGVSMDAFVGEVKPKRKPNVRKAMELSEKQVEKLQDDGRYAEMKGRHFAALFVKLHTHVYGVRPLELEVGDAWFGAASAAERLLHGEFRSNAAAMIEFIRWVWKRERKVEKKRRDDGTSGRRIGWRLMFVQRHLLTDYRVEQSRAAGNG